jgi:signal transduction histidine kinase/DNA-binding response OmpR family regulator
MFNSNFSLTDFAYSVPTCQAEAEISSLVTTFLTTKHHYIAIVDRNDRLVGIVSDRSLYARIIESDRRQENIEYKEDLAKDWYLSKSNVELPIESPILLSAQMSASESIAYFKLPLSNNESNPIYALVDAREKFVGILDTEKLIKFLLLDRQNILESKCQFVIESWQKWSIEILEQFPLPLALQTQEGKTIYENVCWQEQISKANSLNSSRSREKKYLNLKRTSRDRNLEIIENEPSCLSDRVSCQSHFARQQQRSVKKLELRNETKTGDNGSFKAYERGLPRDRGLHSASGGLHPEAGDCLAPKNALSLHTSGGNRIFVNSNHKVPILVENFYSRNKSVDSYEVSSEHDLAPTDNEQNALLYFQTAKACLENYVNSQRSVSSRTMVENDRAEPQDWQTIRLPLQQIFVDGDRDIGAEWEKIYFNSIVPFSYSKDRQSTSNNPCWLVLATKKQPQKSESELITENTELLAINRFKDELIATLSHELKSPLTAILGLSSLLKEQKLGQLNQRQNRYMELIYNSACQLMSLVNDLLDLARLEAGQLELSPESLQIKTVCEDAYQKTVKTLLKKKQRLEFDPRPKFTLTIESGLESINADELRLQQMLVNLLDNAHKFTAADGEIGLVVERWGNYVAFTVWDNGVGIPEEAQSSILRRLSIIEGYKTNSFNSKGLGLILTQKLALAHSGDISFISKVDRGSEFTLLIPISGDCAWIKTGKADRDKEHLTSQRLPYESNNHSEINSRKNLVLVVEEVACDFEKIIFNLKGLGYHFIVARTEVEALEKARLLQPDKILLNLSSSSFFAWDVLTSLKKDPDLKDIPAIAIAPELIKEKAKSNGANVFLSLPLEEEALSEIFPRLSRDNCRDRTSLQILRLYPEADAIKSTEDTHDEQFELTFRNYLSSSHHRIIEADSLEQADLLTRIWKLDVVVIDGTILKNPLEYLRSLKEHHDLASLPLVILDAKTTKIANQISNLSVFPCLIFDREQNLAKVLEVIEIAAKAKNL